MCDGRPGADFPPYDGPDPEPDYDAGDVPPGACWCHDAAVCPDVEALALADRDPVDGYRELGY